MFSCNLEFNIYKRKKMLVKFHRIIPVLPIDVEQPILIVCPKCKKRNHIGFLVDAIVCQGCSVELHNKEAK